VGTSRGKDCKHLYLLLHEPENAGLLQCEDGFIAVVGFEKAEALAAQGQVGCPAS
jgi:hypothetical protein